MLNACIGASSAPFYEKDTSCTKYDLTDQCATLKRWVSALYGFEVVGSLVLVVHGLLGFTLTDYIRSQWLIRTMNYYSKVGFFLYLLVVLLRTAIYLKIRKLIIPVNMGD